jgi:plastocyanin
MSITSKIRAAVAGTCAALVGAALLASAGLPASAETPFPADKAACVVSGKVAFKGKAPGRDEIVMDSKPECKALHGDKKTLTESVVVNENGTLANVFVYVKEGLENYKFEIPKTPAVLDQEGCVYKPHVIGVMVGQPLEVRNSDPLAHNVHKLGGANPEINISQATKGVKNEVVFKAAEVFAPFKCDVHGWMTSYVAVVDHPVFAVTNDKGEFTLPKLPPGKYTIAAKHETGKEYTAEITIADGEAAKAVNFEFARKDLKVGAK